MRRGRLCVAATLLIGLRGAAPTHRTLPQEAYVWQRVWTAPLAEALGRTAPMVRGWRVLVAEWSPDGRLARTAPDWAELASLSLPVVAVLRIDDRHALPAPETFARVVAGLPSGAIAGVEVDDDIPTRRLDEYRRFLHALRPLLPRGLRLSITVLPDWLAARAFPALSREADQLVLQVHAVDDPGRGLFDGDATTRWVARMASRSARPFLVALPAYGVRVVQSADGRVLATEAERPALAGGAAMELTSPPGRVADAVAALEEDPSFGLTGLIWFRVPTRADQRSWSFATWEAVLRRRPLRPHLLLRRWPRPDGVTVWRLVNDGATDASLPQKIAVADCIASDGAGPYRMQRDPAALVLQRSRDMLLPAGQAVTVGWTRCEAAPATLP